MADPDSVASRASPTPSEMQEPLDEAEPPALDAGSNAPNDAEEDKNQDAASAKTTTASLFSQSEGSSSPGSDSKQHRLGLDINYPWGWNGSLYNDYDVVTVHGIRDDYKTAWIDKEGTWWVKDQLFKNLPARESIREVDYSYKIDEESTVYEPNGIKLHAERLIREYTDVRGNLEETETDRPVIWICHDLGGTIVKEALSIAISNPWKYGKIAILTSAIIFLGTPHRCQSLDHLEDQLLKLILLPGPDIRERMLSKVKNLAHQVNSVNQRFLATKLLDRAVIFNIFTQNKRDSLKQKPIDDDAASITELGNADDLPNPVTPFPRYAHHAGHSFEAAGRDRLNNSDHADLVRGGDDSEDWLSAASENFNVSGSIIRVNYKIVQFQARILSLAPPTRALDTPFDPVLPKSPVITWIYKQAPYTTFSKSGKGPRLIHLHGNGNSSVDVSELSRLFYVYYDSSVTLGRLKREPHKTVVYFEFDQWDSRYSTVSSMLTYFINALVWHFWTGCSTTIIEELTFLNSIRSWSLEDLYYLYAIFREVSRTAPELTFFIACFDQCPEDQRQWFLGRVLKEQSYSEAEYRLILSTSTLDGLAVESFPDEARINLADCPAVGETINRLTGELQSGLVGLISRRPIYEHFRRKLESLLEECRDAPHLGQIILTWLGNYHRGKPKSDIADKINKLSPVTAENMVQVFVSSLAPGLQPRAKNVFNWVKHASEPWSPESLTEALAVHEFREEEHVLNYLDAEGTMSDMEAAFGGIIIVKNRDVKFCHPSFYDLPEVGIEGSAEEWAARVNSTIAETCMRYFQLRAAQDMLEEFCQENFEGGPWAERIDAAVISHRRISMAEYAVRFWPQHYKASGRFKPRKLVDELFANKESRAAWEVPFWLLSNTFTRIQRSYISLLPVLAMLELEDLLDEKVQSEKHQPLFKKDCWFAITEAARAGNKEIVQRLLELVTVDEEELQTALLWAAANCDRAVLNALVKKIPNLETFQWPQNILFRAAAAGLDDLLTAMLKSGSDINKISTYWKAPLGVIVALRDHVSTMEILLDSEPKLDLTVRDQDGDTPFTTAAQRGNPGMIELLLRRGASVEARNDSGIGLLQVAVQWRKHKAVDILIKAGADFKSGKTDANAPSYLRPPLINAADQGLRECVRVLLNGKADPNVECAGGSALYKAVAGNHEEVARLLLEHDPKPDMDITPSDQDILLIRAVCTGNTELVSLLIKHGAKIDVVDPNGDFSKTPLSRACYEGDLEMVKLLLENKADINYTGGESDPPLFTALYERQGEVANYLLQDEDVDVKWSAADGMGPLQAAFDKPDMIPKILKKGAYINGHSVHGTVLHMASTGGHSKSIEALLENDPKPDVNAVQGDNGYIKDEIGCTALQLACMHSKPECLKLLLKAGANPKFKNGNRDAVDIMLQTETDSTDAQECLKVLLSRPYRPPLDQVNDQGQTRLHGIQEKSPVSIVQLLVEANVPLDVQDQDGYTPLAIAISKGNESVAKYLIEQGASVNVFGPGFGSILHLAVTNGSLDLVKLLVDLGADRETVDPDYGESLLYTALGIKDNSKLKKMVRYLVDEAKVGIDKLGGELAYPIIRAADLTRTDNATGTKMLKFLIRRKAQLNVADNQGRRAVHFACKSEYDDGIRALVDAGADIDTGDKFGRKPIHFAASTSREHRTGSLLDIFENTDVDVVDHDNWTPLLWAARSGHRNAIVKLVTRGADVWVRGRDAKTEWSALKLANFTDRNEWFSGELEPKERTRVNRDDETEEWDDDFHKINVGHEKDATCKSCLVTITGIQWKCIECTDDFSLCFKCYGHRSDMHDPEHGFEEIEPLYDESASPDHRSTTSDKAAQEAIQEAPGLAEGEINEQDVLDAEGEINEQDILDDDIGVDLDLYDPDNLIPDVED